VVRQLADREERDRAAMRARMRALLLVVLVIATREAEARLDPDAVLAERVQGKDLPGRGLAVGRARNMNFITYHVLSSSGASEAGPMQYLVKTDKAGRQDILKELEDMLGWRAIRYVPFDSFVVSMTAAQRSAVAGLRGCLAVYHLPWVRIVWFL
jgi:hypothetical protein